MFESSLLLDIVVTTLDIVIQSGIGYKKMVLHFILNDSYVRFNQAYNILPFTILIRFTAKFLPILSLEVSTTLINWSLALKIN